MRIDSRQLRKLIASKGLTNAKLAKNAGLSRQALHAMLNKDWAEVREATLEKLVGALKLPDSNLLGEDTLAGYKSMAADEHARMDFRGLGLPATEPRLLDVLFVPLRLRHVTQPKHDERCDELRSACGAKEDEPIVSAPGDLGALTLGECLDRHRRVLLRGEPGGGKTTLLRHIARGYAKGTQSQDGYPPATRTPLFIRLADYAKAREHDADLCLVRFVLSHLQPQASREWVSAMEHLLEGELTNGACLVLLDGLDEVERESNLYGALRTFAKRYADNQFVLTSRAIGLDAGPWKGLGFEVFEITRWQEEDIRRFTLGWYTSRDGAGVDRQRTENERRSQELSATIVNQPPLREIATNPLMLTILAALHHANATLPRRRADLYTKVVEVMLETWEVGKRDACPGDPLHGILLESREFEWLLARLALAMQRQDHILNPRWWITDFVQEFLRQNLALEGEKAKDQGDRVIRYLCERSGLLSERGIDIFGFSHRTFQEYFAALGIVQEASGGSNDAVSLLQPFLYNPRWEEVVRLVAARLAPAQATALLRTILDDPDPAGRFLRRGLRLALRCLAHGAAVADRALLDQLFSRQTSLGELKWLGVPLEVIDVLHDFKTTRHAANAAKMLGEIESVAQRSLTSANFFAIYQAIHGPLIDLRYATDAPGTVFEQDVGGHRITGVFLAPELRHRQPTKWYNAVLRLFRDPTSKLIAKLSLIDNLRYEAERSERARGLLEDRLAMDPSPKVRAASAWALHRAAARFPPTAECLLTALRKDKSKTARAAIASALYKVAPVRAEVRDQLISLLKSSGAIDVRQGAARGLSRVVVSDRPLLESFLSRARSPEEATDVRVACLSGCEKQLGEDALVNDCFISCLDEDAVPPLRRLAAQAIAEAHADGRLPWSLDIVAKTEAILMALANPCVHAWQALRQLVDAKEVRGGMRLENILRDALAAFKDRVMLASVFGSVARREQDLDSDIDLLIVGDVRLKEITARLQSAEQALGRVINPVLYTPSSFKTKCQAGDPFLLEVARSPKLFLKGSRHELGELVAERLSQET